MKHLFLIFFSILCMFFLLTFSFIANIANAENLFKEEKCISQAVKICVDESEKTIDGFQTRECWKYKEIFRCTGKEENNCAALEANRGCREISAGEGGECKMKSPTGLCSHMEKLFVCGNKETQGNEEVKIISSDFKVLKDEKDLHACDPEIKNKYCEIAEENCIEKGETSVIFVSWLNALNQAISTWTR